MITAEKARSLRAQYYELQKAAEDGNPFNPSSKTVDFQITEASVFGERCVSCVELTSAEAFKLRRNGFSVVATGGGCFEISW